MKQYLEAINAMLTFKRYTTLPRWIEISFGICIWAYLFAIIVIILIK